MANDTSNGGIVVVWDTNVFEMNQIYKGERCVVVEGRRGELKWKCAIGIIYSESERDARKSMYESQLEFHQSNTW